MDVNIIQFSFWNATWNYKSYFQSPIYYWKYRYLGNQIAFDKFANFPDTAAGIFYSFGKLKLQTTPVLFFRREFFFQMLHKHSYR